MEMSLRASATADGGRDIPEIYRLSVDDNNNNNNDNDAAANHEDGAFHDENKEGSSLTRDFGGGVVHGGADEQCISLQLNADASDPPIVEPPRDPRVGLRFDDLPREMLDRVFDMLPIPEKLRIESVSKGWQSNVKRSLRVETVFRPRTISGVREIRDVTPRILAGLNDVFRRLSDPITGETNLVTLDLGNTHPWQERSNFMEWTGEFYELNVEAVEFPRLQTAVIDRFTPNLLRSNLLKSLTLKSVSREELSLILAGFVQLKSLRVRVEKGADPECLHRGMKGIFESAVCSLQSLAIDWLPDDSLVNSFPDMKDLRIGIHWEDWYSPDELYGSRERRRIVPGNGPFVAIIMAFMEIDDGVDKELCESLSALTKLRLRSLDVCYPMLNTFLNAWGQLTPDSNLTDSLEHFRIFFGTCCQYCPYVSSRCLLNDTFNAVAPHLSHYRSLRAFHILGNQVIDGYIGNSLNAVNFGSLKDLRLPCVKLDRFVRNEDEFDLPDLENLEFCGCDAHEESEIEQFVIKVILSSVNLSYLNAVKFYFKKGFIRELKRVLPDTRLSSLTIALDRCCALRGSTSRWNPVHIWNSLFSTSGLDDCSAYMRRLNAELVEAHLVGVRLQFHDLYDQCRCN